MFVRIKKRTEQKKRCVSHKSTRMSNISCERDRRKERKKKKWHKEQINNKTQDNEIKDLKFKE